MYIVIAFISSPKFPKYQTSTLCYALDMQRQIRYYALNTFSRKKKRKIVVVYETCTPGSVFKGQWEC